MKQGFINAILQKRNGEIEEHLAQALKNEAVRDRYHPPESRRKHETIAQYAERIMQDAATYQFVRVVWNGKNNFVAFRVSGPLITPLGKFLLIPAEVVGGVWGTHYLLIYPDLATLREQPNILLRIDSGCLSGQLFGDTTCDCREQLEVSKRACVENESGIVINIPAHDGRGWGEFKMANQRLMDELSLDTVEAARMFYGNDGMIDQRTYTEAALILMALGLGEKQSFCFATNNPRKIGALQSLGMKIEKIRAVLPEPSNETVRKNVRAKMREWQHGVHLPVFEEQEK